MTAPALAAPTAFTDSAGEIASDLRRLPASRFHTVLADPPWQFVNKTGKVAPEHRRLSRYRTMTLDEICTLPVARVMAPPSHLFLWCPNALLPDGLRVMEAWGFTYKSNIVWHKIRKDGGSDGRGVGFYFRNVTELLLFGVKGSNARTLAPGRTQVNFIETRKREHSRKPDELYRDHRSVQPGAVPRVIRPRRLRRPACSHASSSDGCGSATRRTMKPPSTSSSSNISPHTTQASRINPSPMVPSERGSLQEVAA